MLRLRLCLFLLFAGALLPGVATAQPMLFAPQTGTVQHAAASQPAGPMIYYFAVLGEVAVPGVYEFTTTNPPLTEVIQRAGGLSAQATGQIGIIRNGRGGHKSFYSTHLKENLLPGDVLVADADSRTGAGGGPFLAPSAPGIEATKPASDVQLAFVGLLDRPVIVKMRAAQASVASIVAFLDQPAQILPSIRIIDTARQTRPSNGQLDSNAPLPSGTVLIFDPTAVAFDRIPERVLASLPLPYRSPDTMIAATPTPLPQEASAAPLASAAPTGPLAGAPAMNNAPTPADSPTIAAPTALEPTFSHENNDVLADAGEDRIVTENDNSGSTNLSATAVCVIACLVSLSAFAVLWSLMPRSVAALAVEAPVQRTVRPSAPQLAALLEDDDPIVEESLNNAEAVRSALLTLGAKKLRVDAAHEPQRSSAARSADARPLSERVRVARETAARVQRESVRREVVERPDDGPDVVLPPQTGTASRRVRGERPASGLLDRVLSSMTGNRRS